MIIKEQQNENKPKVSLIPKHQNGSTLKKMADTEVSVTTSDFAKEKAPDTNARTYVPGSKFTGLLTSTPKRTDSLRGELLTVIKNRINSTANSDNKKNMHRYLDLLTASPGTTERGWAEIEYFSKLDPELEKIIKDPLTMGYLKKRGFDIPPQSTNPEGLYKPVETSTTAQAFKEGGKVRLIKRK